MSNHIGKSIIASECEQRTDHSEEVKDKKIKEIVNNSGVFIVDKRDTEVIL